MQTVSEIIDLLKNNRFVIYGAGGHGKKVFTTICRLGLRDNFLGFAVSNPYDDFMYIANVDRNTLVLVAAHETATREMEDCLTRLGFVRYVSIYPILIDFCCGMPYQKNVEIDVNEFLKSCKNANYLGPVYLGIEAIMGKCEIGEAVYKKHIGFYATNDTIDRRWNNLQERVFRYANVHCPEPFNLQLNPKEHYVLDGCHRLVLAKYFDISRLKADFYDISFEHFSAMFDQRYADDERLAEVFDKGEILALHRAKRIMMGETT